MNLSREAKIEYSDWLISPFTEHTARNGMYHLMPWDIFEYFFPLTRIKRWDRPLRSHETKKSPSFISLMTYKYYNYYHYKLREDNMNQPTI